MDPLSHAYTSTKLKRRGLDDLPVTVKTPNYGTDDLTPGIVHIGLGNFHPAHQACYIQQLVQKDLARGWAIIGPMISYLPIKPENAPLIRQMSNPAIKIVLLTVTRGYYLDANTGAFDSTHDDIRHDAENPHRPRTAFGAIVAALRQRRDAGLDPFTALSCNSLQGNGTILRNCVVCLARLSDPDLADWINHNGASPTLWWNASSLRPPIRCCFSVWLWALKITPWSHIRVSANR